MGSRARSLRGMLVGMLMILGPAAGWAVTTHVRIATPAGEPVETGYVVLDEAGATVARGRTDAGGEDRQDLPPGAYLFRSGDGEQRITIHEGQRSASVGLTRSAVPAVGWGLDLGLTYGYIDHDGDLESDLALPGAMRSSDTLQLNGTDGGLYGRVRFPAELAGGQPFLQVGGRVDLSDARDEGGVSYQPGPLSERSMMRLDLQAELAVTGGLEWETSPILHDRGIRVRPYGGLAFHWWSAQLVNDRSDFMMGIERTDDDFTTTSGRLGVDVGVPVLDCDRLRLDFVFGGHYDVAFGGDERGDRIDGGLGQPIEGGVDLDDAWGIRSGLEVRWRPFSY